MSVLTAVLTLVLLAVVIAVVSGPLRVAVKPESRATRRADLFAAREAKYREIRDTELDYRTGKLSRVDFDAVNGALRTEAVAILDRLEALERERNDDEGGGSEKEADTLEQEYIEDRHIEEDRRIEEQVRTLPPPK